MFPQGHRSLHGKVPQSILLGISCYAFAAQPLHATTLEVGPNQTYKTIGEAISAAKAADSVNVYPGRYAEDLLINKSLVIKAASTDAPVLLGRVTVRADNVTVSGFEITGWGVTSPKADGILQEKHQGLTISHCKIHAGSGTGAPIDVGGLRGSAAGIRVRNSSRTRIENNDIYGCNKGIKIQSSRSDDGNYSTGTVLRENRVHDCPVDGINIQGQYITVEDCTIYNNLDLNFKRRHPDGIQFIAAVNTDGLNAVQHAKILRNTIYNQTQQIFLQGTAAKRQGAGGGELSDCRDVLIANNVCFINRDETVHGQSMSLIPAGLGIGVGPAADVWIYNNTVSGLNRGIAVGDCKDGSIHIKNNILEGNKHSLSVRNPEDIAIGELDYNLYFKNNRIARWHKRFYKTLNQLQADVPTQEMHSIAGDPKLNAFPAPTLQAHSAAIAAGVNLSAVFNIDRAGMGRPVTKSWDIGAFQFSLESE